MPLISGATAFLAPLRRRRHHHLHRVPSHASALRRSGLRRRPPPRASALREQQAPDPSAHAGVVGALALLYVGDLVINSGSMPRGVTVAGVRVGGLGLDEAEQRLHSEIDPRTQQPIQVSVGEALAMDRSGRRRPGHRLERDAGPGRLAAAQTRSGRITSFFSEREVGVVTRSDGEALNAALEELSPIVDKAPVEGSVRVDGTERFLVDPVPGQKLDVPAAAGVLQDQLGCRRTGGPFARRCYRRPPPL